MALPQPSMAARCHADSGPAAATAHPSLGWACVVGLDNVQPGAQVDGGAALTTTIAIKTSTVYQRLCEEFVYCGLLLCDFFRTK